MPTPMNEQTVDALVIGGGPAGTSAAIHLATAGVSTMLCESNHYPRPKVCGEFLSPECADFLARLGLSSLLAESQAVPISTVRLSAPDGMLWESTLPGQAWGLSRQTLDAALARQAAACGVERRDGVTVTRVDGNLATGFEVETRTLSHGPGRLRARLVIAAQGKRGRLDRLLDRSASKACQSFVAFKAHVSGPPLADRIELHTFPGGFCSLSQTETGLVNMGALVTERDFREKVQCSQSGIQIFVNWMRLQNPYLRWWLSRARPITTGWLSVGHVGFAVKGPVTNDLLRAGEAAGLITPLAGHGIGMALQSGLLVAQHAEDYLRGGCSARALKRRYTAAWQREFADRLRLGRALQALMLHPHLFSFVLRLVTKMPNLGRRMIRQTRAGPLPLPTLTGV